MSHANDPYPVAGSKAETVGASPKTVLATAVSTVLSIALAVLNLVNTPAGAGLLGGLNPIAQTLIIAAIPPLAIGLTTYHAAVGRVALKRPEA